MTDRHAYLIMCHTNYDQLSILLDLLDDKRNDIYLHIDKKARGYSVDNIKSHSVNSNLYFIKPMRVNWGGDSQIRLEIKLLAEATKTQHTYYHLISGMDLPLKTQNEIHAFFCSHSGYDYVRFENANNISKHHMDRLKYYYFFQNHIDRGTDGFLSRLQRKIKRKQKQIGINRTKNVQFEFQKGANWFSITHSTACFILDQYKYYKKYFRFTLCADEIFLQTILINSPQIDKIIDNNLRYIDWNRGQPYVFREED